MRTYSNLPQLSDSDYHFFALDDHDLEEIREFLAACDDFSILVSGQPHQPEDALGLLHDLPPQKSEADKQVLGIRNREENLCGILDLVRAYPDESVCFIGLLLLLPEIRGNGLGRHIMQSVADCAKAEGFRSLMLGVVEENQAGRRFWKACGFKLVETSQPRTFGQKSQRVLRMQKSL